MKKMKKLVCLLMVFAIMMQVKPVAAAMAETDPGGEAELQYTNISSLATAITRSGSTATCSADYKMTVNRSSSMVMILQKSADKSSYSNVTFWTQGYSGTGTKSLTRTTSITKGYYYRLKIVVQIYSASGSSTVEKITAYSNVIHYPQ